MTWQRFLLIVIVLILNANTACENSTVIETSQPAQPSRTANITATAVLNTAASPTATPTSQPPRVPTPTEIPPTPYSEPFLPPNIRQIGADNISNLQQLESLPVKEIYKLVFSQSGDKLATLSEPWDDRFNDYMQVWDLGTGRQLLEVRRLDSPHTLFFSTDETQIEVFFPRKGIDKYNLANGELENTIPLDADQVDISPGGTAAATGTYLGSTDESIIQVIDLASKKVLSSFKVPGIIMNIKYSPNGKLLTTGSQVSNHYRVSIWETAAWRFVTDFVDYDAGLTFSPDGKLAASAREGKVYLFSTDGMTNLAWYSFTDIYTDPNPRDFSLAGDLLAIEDRYTIRFLVPELGDELFSLPDECEVIFSSRGNLLVTWCYQGELKIWGVWE